MNPLNMVLGLRYTSFVVAMKSEGLTARLCLFSSEWLASFLTARSKFVIYLCAASLRAFRGEIRGEIWTVY